MIASKSGINHPFKIHRMRSPITIYGLFCLALASCSGLASDEVRNFIPGIYARHYTDEFTNSLDTVEIKPVTEAGSDGFKITKRMRYQKTIDGQQTSFDYKMETWFGIYESDSKTLYIEKSGKRIYFDPVAGELKMGEMPYKKLN
jgi:hypothetical protein